jgi:hypothetical protein
MHDDLIVLGADYDEATDTLTIDASSGNMILKFVFCGNTFSVTSANDAVDAWIVIPAMIALLDKETKPEDTIAHVDAAIRLAYPDACAEAFVHGWDD